eukprot:TRINITY_DN10595_c0_g1_i2.p1 TRINITY_DN10595_c0_g1~~TRINITY_DN10595_c0_g1_i2.p1  ORF type:complete len:100 (-),score=0.76 TRINITY_DN10595_c0_g1_i2:91-390(-)
MCDTTANIDTSNMSMVTEYLFEKNTYVEYGVQFFHKTSTSYQDLMDSNSSFTIKSSNNFVFEDITLSKVNFYNDFTITETGKPDKRIFVYAKHMENKTL